MMQSSITYDSKQTSSLINQLTKENNLMVTILLVKCFYGQKNISSEQKERRLRNLFEINVEKEFS